MENRRTEEGRIPREVAEWEAEGRRRRGKPCKKWIDNVQKDMDKYGLQLKDARDKWRTMMKGEWVGVLGNSLCWFNVNVICLMC